MLPCNPESSFIEHLSINDLLYFLAHACARPCLDLISFEIERFFLDLL